MHAGLLYALLAFVTWGLFPLYFQFIRHVAPVEVVLQRSAWSLLFVLALLVWRGQWAWLAASLRQPRRLALFGVSAVLLAGNWLVYVYAVQSGHVVEASLGYFINPLVNVLLGVLVLRERLRRLQWLAVGLAAAGVIWLTWQGGRLPWISLTLACTFGVYGLMRKTASLGPLEGLALETLLVAPVVLPALAWWTIARDGVLAQGDWSQIGWMALGGPLTALPLLWFAAGARRLRLASLGLIQYLSPSLQFGLGIWYFHEPFNAVRLVGFMLIWTALVLFSADALGWRGAAGSRCLNPGDTVMFSHIFTSVGDFERALAFYSPLMASLGIEARFCEREKPWAGWQSAGGQRPLFVICHPYDGQAHQPGNGQMVAFAATSRAMVRDAHALALHLGGRCEGPPGLRPHYHAHYYGAYFRDPDGNKLCVACHLPEEGD